MPQGRNHRRVTISWRGAVADILEGLHEYAEMRRRSSADTPVPVHTGDLELDDEPVVMTASEPEYDWQPAHAGKTRKPREPAVRWAPPALSWRDQELNELAFLMREPSAVRAL